jgi:CHAT domain-containing protein
MPRAWHYDRAMLHATLLVLLAVDAVLPAAGRRLAADGPVELEIEAGADHAFALGLESGRAYHVEVEQLGTYLELRWSAGTHARRVNDRTERTGREELFWVADAAGPGTLTVGNLTSRPGRYRITLVDRPATAADRARHGAEQDAAAPAVPVRLSAAARFGTLGLVHRQIRTLDRASYRAAAAGDLSAGRAAADECVALARRTSRDEALGSCLLALAHVLETTGDLDGAARHYAESIAVRERLGDPLPIAHALADSGRVLVLQGDYQGSVDLRRRAMALAREVGDEHTDVIVGMSLATVEALRGRVEELLAASERVRDLGRRRGQRELEAIGAMNAGFAYGNLGDVSRSIARFRDAIAVAEAAGLRPTVAQGRIALGAAHEDARDLEAARRELEAGVALARTIQAPEVVAAGETLLGWILARQGRTDDGLRHLSDAVVAAREGGARVEESLADLYTGKVLLLANRPGEADAALVRALAAFRESTRVQDEGTALVALAQVREAQGDLRGAAARADEAIAVFESVRARVALADQRARYAGFRREAYDVGVALAVERDRREPGRGHLARAFELTERARARALGEELLARRAGRTEAPAHLSAAHRRALDRLGHVQRQLVDLHTSGTPEPARRARLERELAEAVAGEEAARRSIREQDPREPMAPDAPPTAVDHARRLAADEAIVLYHVADARSWVFVVSDRGLAVQELPGAAVLRRTVDGLRELLSAPRTLGAGAYAAAARSAFELLLAPAISGRPHLRRLRLVPDGPLWEIPFEALVTGDTAGAGFEKLPYVLNRFTVSYHPSAAGRPVEAREPGGLELVAFADPAGAQGPSGEAAARVERAVFREGERWSLPRLACAEQEARTAAALFGKAARVHVGEEARESVVKSDPAVKHARYLLFATHALLSETMPSQSALVLALSGDGDEDGLLQVHEVDGLALDAELVLLSACETALGENVRGEGLLGLSRAFFHAGARRLMVSQWKIADCGAAEVGVELFRELRGGAGDVATALRTAKRRVARRPAFAHPYYWAPFVLVE